MKAYLSESYLSDLDQHIFNICLLCYERIYCTIDQASLSRLSFKQFAGDMRSIAIQLYCNREERTYLKIASKLFDWRQIDRYATQFWQDSFIKSDPALAPNVYCRAFDGIAARYHTAPLNDCDKFRIHRFVELSLFELFVARFLAKNYEISPVFNVNSQLAFIHAALLRGDFPIWTNDYEYVSEYFPYDTFQEMIGIEGDQSITENFMRATVPDVGSIPISELAKFIAKDRWRPITRQLAELKEKFGSRMTEADITEEVITRLYECCHILWPSASDVAIGILGNVPSPLIVNPIGIWGAAKTATHKLKVEENFKWILATRQLRQMARRSRF